MKQRPPVRFRWAWWLLAYAALGLGLVGILVPGLPTVPFVLLSADAAARGSRRLHAWLRRHRQFGPLIRDWQSQGAVSRSAKWLATVIIAAWPAIMVPTRPKAVMGATGTESVAVVAGGFWWSPAPA